MEYGGGTIEKHQGVHTRGDLTHPLVLYFWEEHNGRKQEVMMRILSRHMTLMERQLQEAININEVFKYGQEYLNLKSEWGRASQGSWVEGEVAKRTWYRRQVSGWR